MILFINIISFLKFLVLMVPLYIVTIIEKLFDEKGNCEGKSRQPLNRVETLVDGENPSSNFIECHHKHNLSYV